MPSKTLWFNRGLFVQSIRNVGWVSLAYLLCLLFLMPLQILMDLSMEDSYLSRYFNSAEALNLFNLGGELQVMLMAAFPVLLAVFLFRYMHVKLSSDFVHSLPLKRERLFVQYALYGILILIAPVLVTGIALFVLSIVFNISHVLTIGSILAWAAQTILLNIFIFTAGIFVAVFTGISVIHGALVYILLFFPYGIFTLVFANLDFYLFGLVPSYYLNANVEQLVPFVRAFDFNHNPLTAWEFVIYTLIAVAAFVIALLVYRRRHAEMATQAVAVRPLRPVFVYGVTFCTMLVGGLYFGETQDKSLAWIIFGYITASILGYYIAQMILEKTWRVFDKWKGYLLFVAGALIVGLCVYFDITGFEHRVPEVANIESVYINSYYNANLGKPDPVYYDEKRQQLWIDSMDLPFGRELFHYEDPQVIELLRKLHLQIVDDQKVLKSSKSYDRYGNYRTISFAYNLKNGEKIVRQYTIPFNQYMDTLKPIFESKEYKTNFYPLLRIDDLSHLDAITFRNYYLDKRLTISDPQHLQELHQIIQKELTNETAEVLLDTGYSWADIDYRWDNGRSSYAQLKNSYTELEKWLKQYGYDQQVRITVDDIKYMLLAKNPIEQTESEGIVTKPMATSQFAGEYDIEIDPNYLPYEFENIESFTKITDVTMIEDCLPVMNNNTRLPGDYLAAVYFKETAHATVFRISEQQLPQSLKELVDQQ